MAGHVQRPNKEIIKKKHLKSSYIVNSKAKILSLFDVDCNDKFKMHQGNSEKENGITSTQQPSIKQIIQLVSLSISQVESFQKCESLIDNFCDNDNVQLFTSILE